MSKETVTKFLSHESVWSYSLYGTNYDIYFDPLKEVIPLANSVGATVVVNTPRTCLDAVKHYFRDNLDKFILIDYSDEISAISPKMLRFLVPLSINASYYFFKDSDSIVGERELSIMRHWVSLENPECLIIRDHPLHVAPILAGMFALSRRLALDLANQVRNHFSKLKKLEDFYAYDQNWLMDNLYPSVKDVAQVYSSYFYFTGESLYQIERAPANDYHIGAQYNRPELLLKSRPWYTKLYRKKLLNLPFLSVINRFFPRVLYGRVRPSIVIAFLYSVVSDFLVISRRNVKRPAIFNSESKNSRKLKR